MSQPITLTLTLLKVRRGDGNELKKRLIKQSSIIHMLLAEVICEQPPPEVANATLTVQGQLFGDSASYSCDSGFEVSDGVAHWTIICQSDKVWSKGSNCTSKGNR